MYYVLALCFLCIPLFLSAASSDRKNYGTLICDEVTSIYDGDTFRCTIKDVHPLIGNRVSIRVNGVDTPEMKGKSKKEVILARKAKKRTVSFVRNCPEKIALKNVSRGKYFRIAADVYCGKESLAKTLIDEDLGYEYYGGRKRKWR
ncbi:MAG: thermonuclease family protein [Fibrobacterales bacterium]